MMSFQKSKESRFMAKHWSEVQDRSLPERPYIFDHFVAAGELTLFTFPPSADPLVYCLSLAAHAAAGTVFGSHGQGKGVRVLAMVGNEADQLEMEKLQYTIKSMDLYDREDHVTDLRFVHKSETEHIFLDTDKCRESVTLDLRNCDVFIIYDLRAWLERPADVAANTAVRTWLRTLTEKGLTVIVFNKSQSHSNLFAEDLPLENCVTISCDIPASLNTGAIRMLRTKVSLFDIAPAELQHWWTWNGAAIETGFDIPDPDEKLTPFQVKKRERQLYALRLEQKGMSRKELAEALDVSLATISRDIAQAAEFQASVRDQTSSRAGIEPSIGMDDDAFFPLPTTYSDESFEGMNVEELKDEPKTRPQEKEIKSSGASW